MTFSEFKTTEPSPDMMAQAEKKKQNNQSDPVNGSEVGTPADGKKEELPSGEKNKKGEVPKSPSPEELRKRMDEIFKRTEIAAGENPDWPPAKGNPEAEKQLAGDLEKGFNSFA